MKKLKKTHREQCNLVVLEIFAVEGSCHIRSCIRIKIKNTHIETRLLFNALGVTQELENIDFNNMNI